MWALLVIGGILGLVHLSVKKAITPTKTGAVWVDGDDTKYLRALKQTMVMGKSPPTWLVNEAMREAYDRGDWAVVSGLVHATEKREETPTEVHAPKEDVTIVIGKNSPLEGVSNDEWSSFVDRLKTQQVGFQNERHVGAYHHNKERLSELSIDPASLTDESAQYEALSKDIAAYKAAENSLIRDFCGDVVTIQGKTHGVTLSGLLGLLKAAGPKNARSWLRNERERGEFPKTTEMFLQTNGLF